MKKIDLACIIEDDPVHVFLTRKFLDMTGKIENIMICKNGKDAFDKLQAIITAGNRLPELILLDLNMPIWDGWQFLDEFIKVKIDQKITIYILTSSTNSADMERSAQYNLRSNYLIKPITLDKLKDVLDQVTE